MTETHDAQGNPTEFPTQVRVRVWDSANMLASNAAKLVQTIVDKGTSGFRKCPECGEKIEWIGDPQVAKYGLDLMRDLMKLFATKRARGGDLTPGDLGELAEEMDERDAEALLDFAKELQSKKAKRVRPAPTSAVVKPQGPRLAASD